MNFNSPWSSLPLLLIGYAFFIFVGSLLIEVTDGYSLAYAFSIFLPIVLLSGAWAVLGPGSYAIRTICSIVAVLALFLVGMSAGLLVVDRHSLPSAQFSLAIIGFGIPLICGAQLPYWLGRMVFGWQLVDESDPPKAKKIGIKEMLTITALIATCLVSVTQTSAMISQSIVDSVEIGDRQSSWEVDPDTGEESLQQVTVSKENIDQFRKKRAAEAVRSQSSGLAIVAGYSVLVACLTLINIPCFCLGMMSNDATKGFCFAASYWLALFFILFFVVIATAQTTADLLSFALIPTTVLALLFTAAAATPMLVVHCNGGKLVSRSYFRRQSEKSNSTESKKVTDPFSD